MKIDNYIGDLLYRHDCVIVSDFGGFVANYKNATIHPVQHSFSPPSKQVAFNSSLKNNDGLLASYISNKLLISYPDACRLIADFVTAANEKLSLNNKLVIDNIGELFYDYEKNLQFVPDEKINYLLDSFGFSEIQSPAIKREKGYEIFNGDEALVAKILPAAKRKKIIRPLLKIISITGVAALLAWVYFNPTISGTISKGLAGINIFENTSQQQTTIANPDIFQNPAEVNQQIVAQPVEEKIIPAEIKNAEPEKVALAEEKKEDIKNNVAEANTSVPLPEFEPAAPAEKVTIEKKPVAITTIKSQTGNYFIIGGCFGVYENAVALSEELKTKGFPSQLLGKGKRGLEMVSISAAPSRDKAEEMLGFIHDSGYPDAWILKK